MLTAYFDDSGTHSESKIVVVAGLFGTEGRLRGLDCNWKKHLERPLEDVGCVKPRLKRFHMDDCQNRRGEFASWSRTESDYFCSQLRKVIIESGVSGYVCAIARKDWDELIQGDFRAILGSAEGNCIRSCFVRTVGWAQHNTFDSEMSFVFDNRPSLVQRDAQVVFDVFKREVQEPSITGIAFLSSYDICALQAADLLAWESYQYAKDILLNGFETPQRPEFIHLTSNMTWAGHQIGTRDAIVKIIHFWANQNPNFLRQIADHFTFFDPANPDYSYLRKQN